MSKLKCYLESNHRFIHGIQFEQAVLAKNKAEAAELFGVSMYVMNNYGRAIRMESTVGKELENYPPGTILVSSMGGEFGYIRRDLNLKWTPLQEVVKIIENHRKICLTYQDTMKWAESQTTKTSK